MVTQGKNSPNRFNVPTFEALEQRHLLTLLGVGAELLFPDVNYDVTGHLAYSAATGSLDDTATPTSIILTKGARPTPIKDPRGFQLHLTLDNQGQLMGGVQGHDFQIDGWIDMNKNNINDAGDYSGVLLTGEAIAFGYLNPDATVPGSDQYDYRLVPTGGALMTQGGYFVGQDIGIVMLSKNSNFIGSFATDFAGGSEGVLGPINQLRSSLAGQVFMDADNNGANNGEAGLNGVTVTLDGTDITGAAVHLTTQTSTLGGIDGSYAFAGLLPGTYSVTQTVPEGDLAGKSNAGSLGGAASQQTISGITVGLGQNGSGYNFGEIQPGSLAGVAFLDANDDGSAAGESGIAGVAVALTGTDDLGNDVSISAVTAADGAYAFAGLRPGTYTISETQPEGFLDAAGAVNSYAAAVTSGSADDGLDFGEIQPGSVAGVAFLDANDDGSADGETGIAGVAVALTGTDDLGNAVSISATTGDDGAYAFTGLRPGTYTISETQPEGFLDAAGAVNSYAAAVTSGSADDGLDFGEIQPGSLAGVVFNDANGNGARNSGELGIAGVAVALTGTDDLGNAVGISATTAADGAYAFTGLRPGTYSISEAQPTGYFDPPLVLNAYDNIGLGSGNNVDGFNFGDMAPASLAGIAFLDANDDGAMGTGESGIAGVAVALTGTDDLGNAVSMQAVTAADGAYAFAGLRPGTYTISETQPEGFLDAAGAVNSHAAAVTSGSADDGLDFGEIQPGSIAGGVYIGGLGMSGVTVTLTGTDDLGNAVSIQAVTGADGAYAFTNLRPGAYSLAEVQPGGVLDGIDVAGSLGGIVGNDMIGQIVVGSGQTGTGYTFNETEMPLGAVQGLVWEDFNNDGLVDFNEQVIAGVTVNLTGINDLGNAVDLTAVTDEDGVYAFTGMRPSNAAGYTLREIQPAGWDDGLDILGMVDGIEVGQLAANDTISGLQLQVGSEALNYNFGELVSSEGRVICSRQTATIGFWQNKNGQALIKALNGGQNATQLGNWLAATFPNLYGHLAGMTNAQVAQYYVNLFKRGKCSLLDPTKAEAQVMAVALATYVSNSTLAGTTAVKYGFKVDEYGVGIRTINVGFTGYAFGVSNWTIQSVLELLWATDERSTDGRLYDADGDGRSDCDELVMRILANVLYTAINELGHIG
ncbi:MAG: SdrD B-like domain-containing protein [Phycisphaerae bacterium]|jgi:protocatechuate 3,4-dioxygenase beta subunit